MTPPCPNCGTIYSPGAPSPSGWRRASITATSVHDATLHPPFHGEEYLCTKCQHRWRVPYRRGIEDDISSRL